MWIIIAAVIIAVAVVLVLIRNGAGEKNSCSIPRNGRKKNGWRTVIQYSAEGKYSGRYPDHLLHHPSCCPFPSIILSFVGKPDIKGIGGTLDQDVNSNNWFDKTNQCCYFDWA